MKLKACLVALCTVAVAIPALAQVRRAPDTVAVVTPAISSAPINNNGCTPINPCAVVTPALGSATLSTPSAEPAAANTAPAAAATPIAPAGRQTAECPPVGGRGGFARSGQAGRGTEGGRGAEGARGAFAGRGGRGDFAGGRGNFGGNFAGRGGAFGSGAGRGRGPGQAVPANCPPTPGRGNPGRNPGGDPGSGARR